MSIKWLAGRPHLVRARPKNRRKRRHIIVWLYNRLPVAFHTALEWSAFVAFCTIVLAGVGWLACQVLGEMISHPLLLLLWPASIGLVLIVSWHNHRRSTPLDDETIAQVVKPPRPNQPFYLSQEVTEIPPIVPEDLIIEWRIRGHPEFFNPPAGMPLDGPNRTRRHDDDSDFFSFT